MYFTGNNGYQNFLVFNQMLSSLILDSNRNINFKTFHACILTLHIVYELNNWPRNPANNFTLKNCSFGTLKLSRNGDKSKFTYCGRGIIFDGKDY